MNNQVLKWLDGVKDTFKSIKIPDGIETIVLDYAGIGDACHARLIAQHLPGNVAWITNPMVANLYRDDPMPVLYGASSPWRDVRQRWIVYDLNDAVHEIALSTFDQPILNVSRNVARYYNTWLSKQTHYADLFFDGSGIKRDPRIIHTLRHLGEPPKGRYVVIENGSITHGMVSVGVYGPLVKGLADMGIESYTVGAENEQPIPGAKGMKGLNLYDTYSLIKGSIGFIGRASGNQSLCYSLPHLPLWEINVPLWSSAGYCGYHSSTRMTTGSIMTILDFYRK